jgi:Mlc titration factor MtfA (ptsG expression regulator)
MLKHLYRARLQHVLLRSRIPYPLWHDSIASVPVLSSLDPQEQHRLRRLASLFLHEKTITGAGGLSVDSSMRVYIAAQACLLILNLDLDYFRGWSEVIVYLDTLSSVGKNTIAVVLPMEPAGHSPARPGAAGL